MNLLTRFGLARSRFTIATMIGLLVAGMGLYPNFPKREDPVIVIRTAVVSALFPGMAPERMENLVAVPIERKIRELPEVKDIRTLAGEGSLMTYVDLKDETRNVNAVWQRLRDKMGDVKNELPDGVVGPFVNSDFGDVAIATIAITGEGFSPRELKDVAEDFRKKLYQLAGVSKVELFGVQDERIWLELDTRKLAAVGVQVNALIKDLQGQNVVLPSGNINASGMRLLLETSGDFPNVRAIETMLTRVVDYRQPGEGSQIWTRFAVITSRPKSSRSTSTAAPPSSSAASCSRTRMSRSSAGSFVRPHATMRHGFRSAARSISRPIRPTRSAPPSTPLSRASRRPSWSSPC